MGRRWGEEGEKMGSRGGEDGRRQFSVLRLRLGSVTYCTYLYMT